MSLVSGAKLAALILVVAGLCAHAQVTYDLPAKTVNGIVESVSGTNLKVSSGSDLFLLAVDGKSMLWKGRVIRDLSSAHVGDTITARCRLAPSGQLIVESLWLNVVTFFGTISTVTPHAVEVLMNQNADPQSAYRRELRIIDIDADTTFEASVPEDLQPGGGIQVVGTTLGKGRILAGKVVVYAGNRPVRMHVGSPVVAPDGRQTNK